MTIDKGFDFVTGVNDYQGYTELTIDGKGLEVVDSYQSIKDRIGN